jgi:uncharacterized protein (TIGR02271 family)
MSHSFESGDPLRAAAAQAPNALMQARVVDAGGRQASVVSLEQSGSETFACIKATGPGDGPQVLVPVSLMLLQPDGSYHLPFAFNASRGTDGKPHITFPVRQEQLHIGKRVADTGRGVRIHKTVLEQEHVVDEPLLHDELAVEHVPVGALVSHSDPPRMRYEGDTLVVPVLEEVLVVQKQLRLKEEVRITRHRREAHAPQTVTLRSEQVVVERFDEATQEGQGRTDQA